MQELFSFIDTFPLPPLFQFIQDRFLLFGILAVFFYAVLSMKPENKSNN